MLAEMFENFSLSLNNSLPVSSTHSSNKFYSYCIMSSPGSFIYTTLSIIRICLILPICIFILNHVLQQQKKKSPTSSEMTSHCDYFTYHVVIMELIDVLGCMFCYIGIYTNDLNIIFFGILVMFFVWYGQMSFHVLTCVERYLAVVHPITYVGLRNEGGIRNSIIGCVWLLCFAGMGLAYVQNLVFPACMLISSLTTVSFCSLSVLCVLIRPGPGEHAANKERVVPSKQRAFYTIVAILAVLLLRIAWGVMYFLLYLTRANNNCIIIVSCNWFTIPSSLVLPWLFLHRAGKLECCKM
ncbi:hypothetical protein ILYODFUR_025604 [Ilyodon furcidens]|uniref:G-protein coupled receptors family 1 profile domain-containing protein n=1 Tax=Ilyodon furcidens TaxID=33524 RepID=A0ABV0U1E4_9TELE